MIIWDMWKKGFDTWERTTAAYLEEVLRNPLVLQPSGNAMSSLMKAKAQTEKQTAAMWGMLGLPTRHDQERTLHQLNQLQSRLLDLEEKLEELSN